MAPIFSGPPKDWAWAIGLFLINFGSLDFLIFDFLESRLEREDFVKLRKLHLRDRVERVAALLRSDNDGERKGDVEEFLERLDPIRELRNRIAHGYFLVRLDKDGQTPLLTLALPKEVDLMYEPESQHLTFDDLTNASEELKQVIDLFQAVSGRWKPGETFTFE